MDDLDRALMEAWGRVWELCRREPGEARRRWVRARGSEALRRPSRAWCLGIRASDTRISGAYGVQEREALRLAHTVELGVGDVVEWCGPVRIGWPGVPIDVAAARLGRHVETVRRWLPVKQGRRPWRTVKGAAGELVGREDGEPKAMTATEWLVGCGNF